MKAQNDFSKGSVTSNILRMAGPMTLALLINVLYNVVDRMYIGHIAGEGRLALTGVGLTLPIITMVSAFQCIVSTGGPPIFSIARGEGNGKKASAVLGNAFLMCVVVGVILTVIGEIVKEPLLLLIGADKSTVSFAVDYIGVYLLGSVAVMISMGLNPFITAQGFATKGMVTVAVGAAINIALDPVFIFAFNMGVKGAALATVISQLCSALWVLAFFRGKKTLYKIDIKNMKPNFRIIGKMTALGVTGFTALVTNSAVTMVYNSTLSAISGTLMVSAMTVVSTLREIAIMPASGITAGAQPILGFNYGAKKYDRVKKCIVIMTLLCLLCSGVFFVLFMAVPEVFVRIFNSDPDLLPVASKGIRLFFCCTVLFAFQTSGQTIFVSLGKTKRAVFFSLLRKVILVIPLAIFLPKTSLGVWGVFLSEPISDVVGGIACYATMYFTLYRKLH